VNEFPERLYRHAGESRHPGVFENPGFRVGPGFAGLPGMTFEIVLRIFEGPN
jgi:hypothetical protein